MPIPTEITPLGVGGAVPTLDRHLSGLALRREGRLLLFDCGEGTQLQLLRAGLLGSRLEAVFITHLHGDHVFGLPGLLSTLSLLEHSQPLTIVGPEGLGDFLSSAPGASPEALAYPVHLQEWDADAVHATVYETPAFRVEARPLDHRVPCMGYRFEEASRPGRFDPAAAKNAGVEPGPDFETLAREGRVQVNGREVTSDGIVGPERPGTVIAYCLDTAPCEGARTLARGADLLIHDATFGDEDEDRAASTYHSTARQAAGIARDAGARRLLLTHFSARYPDPAPLAEEARQSFSETEAAEELRTLQVFPRESV